MSGLRTFSCVMVLCGAAVRGPLGAAIGGQLGREIGDKVEDFIRDFIDREPQAKEPQTREPQAPREPIRDFYDYGYSFGHAW
ncbi:hypothetical protein VN0510_09770 [Helicobacter pylori]